MRVQLSVRIQTKGTRPRHVEMLQHLLDVGRERLRVVYGNDLWQSCKDCLLSKRRGDTHLLILQDDILPCIDLVKTVEKIITIVPDEPITLFSTSDKITEAIRQGGSWARLTAWFMAQAYIMPVGLAENMAHWISANVKESVIHDDDRMATYMWHHSRRVLATAPCLVEHLGWNYTTLQSYKKGFQFEPRLRMANQFIGFEKSGLEIDWRAGLTFPPIDRSGSNSMFCSNIK